jgi:hypothetical protein
LPPSTTNVARVEIGARHLHGVHGLHFDDRAIARKDDAV